MNSFKALLLKVKVMNESKARNVVDLFFRYVTSKICRQKRSIETLTTF